MTEMQEMNETNDANKSNEMNEMNGMNEMNEMTAMNEKHARLPHRNACQDFTRATSYGNLHEKCPKRRHTHFARPAQSKRMSRFYTRRFIRKLTGNMPQKRVTTLIKHQPSHLPSEPLSVDTLSGEECFTL